MAISERFWGRVERRNEDECWYWQGKPNADGYGKLQIQQSTVVAHRVSYTLTRLQLLEPSVTVDHVCHNLDLTCKLGTACPHRLCVNPLHLEVASFRENTQRARGRFTTCSEGHPFDYYDTEGKRRCRTCNARRQAEYRLRKKFSETS